MIRSFLTTGLIFGALQSPVLAETEDELSSRLELVGVIAGAEGEASNEVVVLRDKQSKKSVFVRLGEKLSSFPQYEVVAITPREITLSEGGRQVTLAREGFPDTGASRGEGFADMGSEDMGSPFDNPYGTDGSSMPPPPPPPPPFFDGEMLGEMPPPYGEMAGEMPPPYYEEFPPPSDFQPYDDMNPPEYGDIGAGDYGNGMPPPMEPGHWRPSVIAPTPPFGQTGDFGADGH